MRETKRSREEEEEEEEEEEKGYYVLRTTYDHLRLPPLPLLRQPTAITTATTTTTTINTTTHANLSISSKMVNW